MYSYIDIHHFLPEVNFPPHNELIPLIDHILFEKRADLYMDKEDLPIFKANILQCMQVYYRLLGIDTDRSRNAAKAEGLLPRYVESLIGYFRKLEQQHHGNKEITILKYSGVKMIKIHYKYTESVIKKLVKLGLRDAK
ncbi:MAG TPA: hypothetical protein ENL02_00520, partial [Epsilonproteobacteria bacterium]|nr:hypothetical protein [Campylobacterota bacterium]